MSYGQNRMQRAPEERIGPTGHERLAGTAGKDGDPDHAGLSASIFRMPGSRYPLAPESRNSVDYASPSYPQMPSSDFLGHLENILRWWIIEAYFSGDLRADERVPLAEVQYVGKLYEESLSMQWKITWAARQVTDVLGVTLDPSRLTSLQVMLLFVFTEGLRAGWFTRGAVQESIGLDEIFALEDPAGPWEGWNGICL